MVSFRLQFSAGRVFLAGLVLMLAFAFSLKHAQAQGPLNKKVFLPIVTKAQGSQPPPPQPVRGALFAEPDTRTASASIVVDSQGGMHLAYYYFLPAPDRAAAVYVHCPRDCANTNNWNGMAMGEGVNEVQLELTPAGRPRLLIRANSTQIPNGNDIFYAACDQNCVNGSQWNFIYLTSTSGMASFETQDTDSPQHSFALDPQGRPRFVYLDRNTAYAEPDHLGTFYVYCDSGCTNPANWFETKISWGENPFYEHFYYPSLAFTSQGQPRIVADGLYLVNNQPLGIYYLACDGGCDDADNWNRAILFDRGSGPNVSWDLEMNGNRPRLAFYQGALVGGGDILYYTWCNSNCLNGGNWQGRSLGLGTSNGRGPDLELDGQGRPRIAYSLYDVGGLGYSWCTGTCESAGGTWQHRQVETRANLYTAWPVAYPLNCTGGLWDGLTPSLALDGAGNPRFAYDAVYHAQCLYDDPYDNDPRPYFRFHLIERAVRIHFFPQP